MILNIMAIAGNPSMDPEKFLDFMYGDVEGFIYAPTKDPQTDKWQTHWFRNPSDRKPAIEHFRTQSPLLEVYFGPALYSEQRATKEFVLGSNVVWTEFDGNIPKDWKEIPPPTMRIQSSENGFEHVYWRLNAFEHDIKVIERINRSITFSLGADGSSWDCTQILRPVGTLNHKHDGRPVISLTNNAIEYDVEIFGRVPEPPSVAFAIDTDSLPAVMDVIAKYKWSPTDFNFFKGAVKQPDRSSSLMRLAYICCELHMSNEEAYTILYNADERWKKYYKRHDRRERLLDLITRGRAKYPLESSENIGGKYVGYQWGDFLNSEVKIEWLIPGVLQRKGYFLLTGPQGIGKTQISMMFAQHMAIGKDFIGWQFGKPSKIIFFSMEMGFADLKWFAEQQKKLFTPEELDLLQENLKVYPLGHGVPLDDEQEQAEIEYLIREFKPAGIMFDSLGLSTLDELGQEKAAKGIAAFNAKIREEYDLFVWFIHHHRKAQATNKKPNKLEDIFGSIYVTATATTIVSLWQVGDDVEVKSLKVRLSKPFSPFLIRRNQHLGFDRVETNLKGLEPAPLEETVEEGSEDEGSGPFDLS